MSRATRAATAFVGVVALSVAVAGGVAAKPSGPGPGNSANATKCQGTGYQDWVTSTGQSFSSAEACTSYAARGGVLTAKTPATAQSTCTGVLHGTFGDTGPPTFQCVDPQTPSPEGVDALRGFCPSGYLFQQLNFTGGTATDYACVPD